MAKEELATIGGGCFWCIEAVYLDLKGVHEVVSGYSGGFSANPTYEEVCSGQSGHAEVVQIKFDPDTISFKEIIEIFFFIHDPTTLNRQGNDVGTQYRSVIFTHDENQKILSNDFINYLSDEKVFPNPIVTEINSLNDFYEAEAYHQNYYEKNPNQGYCRVLITPKVNKFRKKYFDKLKNK